MSRPRVLVVRSGANPFHSFGGSPKVEIVERVSHAIEPVDVPAEAFEGKADLALFTSQVAVERVLGDARLAPPFRRCVETGRIVAVGRATEEALRSWDLPPDLVAAGSGESMLERLPGRLEGQRVVFPCGEDASLEVSEGLRARGAVVERLVVYRKVPNPPDPALGREIIEAPFAAFCTTSPSAARWLFTGLPQTATERLRRTPAVTLGPFTRRYLESHGVQRIEVTEEARFRSAAAALEALASATVEKA
jgi:uroporphyrinogen-III synthase